MGCSLIDCFSRDAKNSLNKDSLGPFEADIRTSIGLLEGSTGFALTAFLIREQMGLFILAFFLNFDLCHRSCKSLKESAGTSERRALLPELVSYMKNERSSGKIAPLLSGVSTVSISFPFSHNLTVFKRYLLSVPINRPYYTEGFPRLI